MSESFLVYVNGQRIVKDVIDPETTLLTFLRNECKVFCFALLMNGNPVLVSLHCKLTLCSLFFFSVNSSGLDWN